jgi:hypothetical protein
VQRQAAGPAVGFAGTSVDLPESKVEFGRTAFVSGSVGSKGSIAFEPVESPAIGVEYANQGAKVNFALAKQEAVRIANSITLDEVSEGLSFELSRKQVNVSFAVNAKLKTALPFLSGKLSGKLVVAGVQWEKPDSATAFGLEVSGSLVGQGPIRLGDTEVMVKSSVTLAGTLRPNWHRILGEAGKRAAQGAADGAVSAVTTEAGTVVLSVDTAALASGAATIVVPVAAAVGMAYGVFQDMKNTKAAVTAAQRGVSLRQQAREYAEGYARTLTGGSGSGPGAVEAERLLAGLAVASNATRDMAVAAVRYQQGSYQEIHDRAYRRIRDAYYAEACRQFDESHRDDFGFVESIGDWFGSDDWGMKGVFRDTLRIVLYSDE